MVLMAREVITYSLLNGAEQAVTGYVWLGPTSVLGDLVAGINANQNALWASLRGQVPAEHRLVGRELQVMDPGTGVVTQKVALNTPTDPAGSNVAGSLPLQVSTVLSLRGVGASRSSRGRIYLPPLAKGTCGFDTLLVNSVRDSFVTAHKTYFDAVKTAAGAGIGIWSRKNLGWTGAVKIDMGSVFDTQRRRRHKLVEARYSLALA